MAGRGRCLCAGRLRSATRHRADQRPAAGVTALRGSARHGGADAALDLSAHYARDIGTLRFSGGGTGHVFLGASGLSYAEIDGRISHSLGPAQLSIGASYAPPQHAIGGDNLYLHAGLDVGLPGTPLSLSGRIGRSSGSVDDPARSRRLRPDGRYWDHVIGLDYLAGPFALGLRYSATTIGPVDTALPYMDRHHGARLAGVVRVRF
ncbi:MAG: hypothetical protein J0G94_01150 [Sphingomonadales bacterium]|nr:hypothetical protein [Sphingomonadales bacterium]